MPLTSTQKEWVLSNRNKPIVGLIHKTTSNIVFALCIPEKVCIELNAEGQAISGYFMASPSVETPTAMNQADLIEVNALLEQGYVPRLAYTPASPFEPKSSHQFLFEQQCQATRTSEWGGFALVVNHLDQLAYTFCSGAFNSPPGKRTQGAELSPSLISEVKRQTATLGYNYEQTDPDVIHGNTAQTEDGTSTPATYATPEKRTPNQQHEHAEADTTNFYKLLNKRLDGLFASVDDNMADAATVIHASPNNKTSTSPMRPI